MGRGITAGLLCAVLGAPVSISAWGQAPASPFSPAAAGSPSAATPSSAAAPSSLDQPPTPATILFSADQLTIEAANSSLRAILDQLSRLTGVQVQGLSKDERIFGVYGPGAPQEVLASLLDSSGYNVLIAGRKPDGAPREVVLTTRGAAPASTAAPASGARTQAAEEDDEGENNENAPPPPQPSLFAPPQQIPNANNGQPSSQVKTPQQMFEELQRMHQAGGQTPPQ